VPRTPTAQLDVVSRLHGTRSRAAALMMGAALLCAGCQPGEQSSSSSHWIACTADADCDNFPFEAACSAGFCVDEGGDRIEESLTFEADLDGTLLDTQTFRFETGVGLRNAELQAYTESSNNVFLEGGDLVLVARHEPVSGAEYTSGSVEVIEAFSFGRIEASIKSSVGSGVKPVFWLLPAAPGPAETTCVDGTSCSESTWPVWGGLVVLSGRADGPSVVAASYASQDTGNGTLNLAESVVQVPIGPSISTAYHLYAIEWGPRRVDWFVDDELVHSFNLDSPEIYLPGGTNPFHQSFRIKLSLSVGGLVEDPVPEDYPREMRVRSLRVLQVQ
jgi:beta-glucanase (GH16 family)